jgi:hypothetical protein
LANLFLHYAFDMWMKRTYPHIQFERYADDAICHCKSAEEAQALWSALADRFAACKSHPCHEHHGHSATHGRDEGIVKPIIWKASMPVPLLSP